MKHGSDLAAMIRQLKLMLTHPDSYGGLLGTAFPLCLRLHIPGDKTIIHCSMVFRIDYFVVCDKWPWPPTPVTTPRPPKVTHRGGVTGYDYSWFPKGYVRLNIPCAPTREFKKIILRQLTPGVRKAAEKW
ncbi:MAG: hypothetical protein HY318_02205 [Armatimonadetes bacterium]|nr:hypothetical protein [Armatimonadota bacterium]